MRKPYRAIWGQETTFGSLRAVVGTRLGTPFQIATIDKAQDLHQQALSETSKRE
jgi:hypothetical protein